jgi:hypothetical protein
MLAPRAGEPFQSRAVMIILFRDPFLFLFHDPALALDS